MFSSFFLNACLRNKRLMVLVAPVLCLWKWLASEDQRRAKQTVANLLDLAVSGYAPSPLSSM
jgi:hypothetical protein